MTTTEILGVAEAKTLRTTLVADASRNLCGIRTSRTIDQLSQFSHNLLKLLIAIRQLRGAGSYFFFQASVGVLQFFGPKIDKSVEVWRILLEVWLRSKVGKMMTMV
ncbi:MAG: hypothetical protein ABIU05_18240 [Nitrospirales bacterium]